MVSKLFGKIAGRRLIPEGNIFNGDESGFTICHTSGKILITKGKRGIGALPSAEKEGNVDFPESASSRNYLTGRR